MLNNYDLEFWKKNVVKKKYIHVVIKGQMSEG